MFSYNKRCSPSKGILLHIVLNDFTHDSRVLKETESISNAFSNFNLWITALKEKDTEEYEDIETNRKVWRVPLFSRELPKDVFSQSIKYLEWISRIVFRFLFKLPKIVHCHDLSALPVGVVFKLLCGSSVIYDAHEFETERHGLRGLRKNLSKITERFLINFVNKVITVSPSIAKDYSHRYRLATPLLVRNIPANVQLDPSDKKLLRLKVGIPDDEVLYIYQGGLSEGRGIEKLLAIYRRVLSRNHIVFMGNGPLVPDIISVAAISKNVHYLPSVLPSEVLRHTYGADIGICFIEDTCLSYQFSLPNKLFEFLKAGLPVIINNLPDQKELVEKYDCGWIIEDETDDQVIINLINTLTSRDVEEKKFNSLIAAKDLEWRVEIQPVIEFYRNSLAEKSLKN